jgi:hypothetical protein
LGELARAPERMLGRLGAAVEELARRRKNAAAPRRGVADQAAQLVGQLREEGEDACALIVAQGLTGAEAPDVHSSTSASPLPARWKSPAGGQPCVRPNRNRSGSEMLQRPSAPQTTIRGGSSEQRETISMGLLRAAHLVGC